MPRLLPRVAPADAQPPLEFSGRRQRTVHPWAWWGWALSASAAVSLTTNPLVVGLICLAMVVVVLRRRTDTPWARSLKVYLVLAAFIIGMRLLFQIAIGGSRSGTVLFTLPSITLPAWAAGITLGGAVTVDGLGLALFEALRLAAMLLCVGAANSLANPRTALKSVPAALRDISTAVVIALALVPQLIASVGRVRRGQRLRGGTRKGLRAFSGTLIPVLEDAVEGSLQLAASMEARGYGRTRRSQHTRRGVWQLLGALVAIILGSYVLLAVPARTGGPLGIALATWYAVALIAVGAVLAAWGLWAAGSQMGATRYRPAPWGAPEYLTLACGLAAFAAVSWLVSSSPAVMNPRTTPLSWPVLPPLALLPFALLLVPGFATPRPRKRS